MKKRINSIAEKIDEFLEAGGTKKLIILLCIAGVSLVLSLLNQKLYIWNLPFDIAWVSIILCGIPILLEAAVGLVTEFNIKAGVLVSIALVASVCIGEDFAAGEVAFIMQLGELLEHMTVEKARAGIERLVHLTPETARVIVNGTEKIIPADAVQIGDVIRVLPGESVPVDGVILSGQTSINQAVMTGESLPVDKTAGDEVFSGTVNQFGAFDMRASKVGEDSSIQRMIKLVQSADAGKAKIVSLADRWATWIVVIALAAAALTWAITGEIIRAVTILVVFCPCALVLATPTAIMAAIGNATKHGFLVRAGDALERLAKVSKITFDKTGTLTCGTPEVTAVKSVSDYTEDEILAFAAAAEQMSEHPLGKAVMRSYGKQSAACEQFRMIPGEGVIADVDGKEIKAGKASLMSAESIPSAEEHIRAGSTVIYVSVDNVLAGYIALADTIREESAQMIASLSHLGVTSVLLTGDNENAAFAIGTQLGIAEIRANCLPEDKMRQIEQYQNGGASVCMIGDGINDAPALKTADVGIAMGGIGSDIALDAADIVLVDDEIKELPHLIALSGRMMRTIKWNMVFSMGLNFLAIALAATGHLNPVLGALVHNAGSVAVIINSALLLGWKRKISRK